MAVSGGYGFSLATKTDGTLWAWGEAGYGQLGNGATVDKSSPVQVGALTNWLKVAGNYEAGYSIKTDGTLWSWGKGDNGQLGVGNTTNYSSPVQVGALTTWAKLPPVAGFEFCGAIKTDGTLWTWGCLLYTSPSPRDGLLSRMPSSA